MNIWQDPEAAGYVRTYRDGFETVPTVVTGDGRMIDATPQPVKDFLAQRS
ncbi:MAG: hypothetical protein AAF467_24050 [Actinomycetota bacterium]